MPAPMFGAAAKPAAGGYTGLGGILSMLNGGINQSQFDNLGAGYNGRNGAVGQAHGAFQGLSPWAVHYLTTSGLLQKQAPAQQDVTGLQGDQLFMANLMNGLSANGPASYKLHSGVDATNLGALLDQFGKSSGHSAYATGYNATGAVPQQPNVFHPPHGKRGGVR